MKFRLFLFTILVMVTSALFGENAKSVSFIVTGNVRAEFNLCG